MTLSEKLQYTIKSLLLRDNEIVNLCMTSIANEILNSDYYYSKKPGSWKYLTSYLGYPVTIDTKNTMPTVIIESKLTTSGNLPQRTIISDSIDLTDQVQLDCGLH
jgi:hypothetical protein